MQVEVVGELRCEPRLQEGPAERVGVRGKLSVRFGREHEPFVGNGDVPEGGEVLLLGTELSEGRDGTRVDGDLADARTGLRGLDDGSSVCWDHRLVNGQRCGLPADVGPTKRACLPSSQTSRCHHAKCHRVATVESLLGHERRSGVDQSQHLFERRCPHRLRRVVETPRRDLRIGHRIVELVAAPLPGQATSPVEHRPHVTNRLAAGTVGLQLAEEFLYVVRAERGDPLLADRLLDVELPDALVPTGRHGAQVIPPVRLPPADGIVDRGGRTPGPACLVGNDLRTRVLCQDQASQLFFCCTLRTLEVAALVSDPTAGISTDVDSQLPRVRASVKALSNAPGHVVSS